MVRASLNPSHYQTLEIVCIGIMFQLPQNDIYVDSRNWKTCLLSYALRDAYKYLQCTLCIVHCTIIGVM